MQGGSIWHRARALKRRRDGFCRSSSVRCIDARYRARALYSTPHGLEFEADVGAPTKSQPNIGNWRRATAWCCCMAQGNNEAGVARKSLSRWTIANSARGLISILIDLSLYWRDIVDMQSNSSSWKFSHELMLFPETSIPHAPNTQTVSAPARKIKATQQLRIATPRM